MEVALCFYKVGYYDPTVGKIHGDLINFSGRYVNFYVYVQNIPVNYVYPTGDF